MKIDDIINERITRPEELKDNDPSLWKILKKMFTSNNLGTDDRKSRRNKLDNIETRRAQRIRQRDKVDKRIRRDNAEKQDRVDRELNKREKARWDGEDEIADKIAQELFGKNAHELGDLDRANVIRTSRHVVDHVRRFGTKVFDDPNYVADFKKKYPQGLIPAIGKNLDGTDAEPDYSYLNPKKRGQKYSHPAFSFRFDQPAPDGTGLATYQGYASATGDGYATPNHVKHDLGIEFEPRSTIYRSNTNYANSERDERIATGKANIKNIEIQNKINKATTDTPTDNTQKKFAKDIMQNNTGDNQKK